MLENASINYNEEFWLKDGYILINFDIQLIRNEKPYISYTNIKNVKEGYCNMWNLEGFVYNKQQFLFNDGDCMLYNLSKSAATDYKNRGTH